MMSVLFVLCICCFKVISSLIGAVAMYSFMRHRNQMNQHSLLLTSSTTANNHYSNNNNNYVTYQELPTTTTSI